MDFILSLTHFCEMHGPKSVLCTQVLPLECSQCQPPSLQPSSSSSSTSLATQIHEVNNQRPGLSRNNTHLSLSPNFSGASTTVESAPESPVIERHELFVSNDKPTEQTKRFRFSGARGDTCASCSLVLPEDLARELPDGAPGSLRPDGKTQNGAPVLRSREMICLGSGDHTASGQGSLSSTHQSSRNPRSGSPPLLSSRCHDHLLTYLSSRNPDDPENFSALRASVIRTLSRELLPAGMSDGRFCFGDTTSGYTIAYVFRLPDPKARGRRRLYAFVALAGKDACRAFRACPLVWDAFSKLAKAIEAAAVESQDERRRRDEEEREQEASKARNYTPVSSFLAHRAVDPGNPRKAGHIAARSLTDMVGNDRIFSDIHSYFVSLLHHLGELYGGLPWADEATVVCETTVKEDGLDAGTGAAANLRTDRHSHPHAETETRDPKSARRPRSSDATARKVKVGTPPAVVQCAPIAISQPTHRQLVI